MYRLIVKNFGPLKDIDITLNKINIFIGENGSGKSVLAKLIDTILNFSTKENFIKKLKNYNIFFKDNKTIIKLIISSSSFFILENNKFTLSDDIKLISLSNQMFKEINNILEDEKNNSSNKENIESLNKNYLESSKYIPAERNLISLFNKYLSTFITADIPLPKFLLNFSSDYVRAREEFKELEFLNVKYVNSTEDRIYYNDNEYIKLEHSSSGIQSALPLYLTVKYYSKKHHSIIIEEPEQNLFPKAQKETVEFIVEHINKDSSLYLMTHSPYILTSINNLILAYDVKEQKGEEAIKGIIKKEQCINFDEVSAYYIENGKTIDIKDYENRLINAKFIDSISDEIDEEFDLLLSKLD